MAQASKYPRVNTAALPYGGISREERRLSAADRRMVGVADGSIIAIIMIHHMKNIITE